MKKLKLKLKALVLVIITGPILAKQSPTAIYESDAIHHPVIATQGMVSTQEAVATQIGLDILKKGGNAVDASVAIGFALSVTLPRAGNLGGGGFMVIHDAKSNKTTTLDYREMAPQKASRDMFLDEQGEPDQKKSRFHGLAVGVPGTVAGMIKALETYGTMPLSEVIAPAIDLAENGIVMTPDLYNSLINLEDRLKQWDSTKAIFYKGDDYYQIGEKLKQPDLARSLKRIAESGRAGFYTGETAERISKAVNDAGGMMAVEDFANYEAVFREPITGQYRGYEIVSMPPPSSGGTHIVQILNMLENYPIAEMGHNTANTLHLMAETMKLAYADRSEYLGDPDFVKVPIKGLTSKAYAKSLIESIGDTARPAAEIKPNNPIPFESNETTHYSVMDQYGNAVANTYTINFSYGTGLVADGTGILLNNEMDDFSAKPGTPNGYGLIGGDANAVAGKKRPLSSMSPTLVLKDGKPFLATGSPGGSRIITTTLQVIMNVIDHQMNIAEATNASRIHHQWLPDELRVEKTLNKDTVSLLQAKGHDVKVKSAMGSTQSIMKVDGILFGASDPRRAGASTAGY
ncbi:gamma-glutamyltransferase [Ostreibacterium oceani]|uniref:Glutathione hydrolase proenzyme n=1 Tax=Ostreibacterium oceani TaxID=2654998 RepID=A0A6N7EXV4_9GAMM|nr:gamma-glutamyltransferase [Ostreibacterium oceani]MPV86219.1 gamma-glutamyltransferase [Ostreibacterium oceani]